MVKSCAVPVWKLSFFLILGPWPHIGPVPGTTLGCLWGPGGLPSGARRLPRDKTRRPKPPSWTASRVPLGAGPPEGGRGLQGDNPGDPKWASRSRGAQVLKNTQKRRALACVEMCTPSRQEAHIGQKRAPGERESRRLAEKYKQMQKHTLLKMCTPSRSEAHFVVIGAAGELFVVAIKGACGSHFDQPGSLA